MQHTVRDANKDCEPCSRPTDLHVIGIGYSPYEAS